MTSDQTVWIGVASLAPLDGSKQQRENLSGGYGFVAVLAITIEEAVKLLRLELADGGSELVGFDWLSRIQDYEEILSKENAYLVEKLEDYPVQFSKFHWHTEKLMPN